MDLPGWRRRAFTFTPFHPDELILSTHSDGVGPWSYTDPDGHQYLLQLVPLEWDPTLAENRQPKAVVFQTADGWIRVTPVGHDFSPADLSKDDLNQLLRVAAGRRASEEPAGG